MYISPTEYEKMLRQLRKYMNEYFQEKIKKIRDN